MLDQIRDDEGCLEFVARSSNTVLLRDSDGKTIKVASNVYRQLISEGRAEKPGDPSQANRIPDEHARIYQAVILHAIQRDDTLRRAGNTAAASHAILVEELRSDPQYSRYVPAKCSLRTLQNWRQKIAKGGKDALIPKFENRGNRGARFDALYEETAWDVLEENFLKNDRMSIGAIVPQVEEDYLERCKSQGVEPGPSGKRCLETVLQSLRVDDLISARHDSSMSKKLRLQAQFFHRVEAPLDVVEIDCTVANTFCVGATGELVGRPTICAAVDVATGFPVGLRISLENPNETLVVGVIKDVMTPRGPDFFEEHGISNRLETTGTLKVIVTDQGSENSGSTLTAVVRNTGMEFAKTSPAVPKRSHILNGFSGS
ncbi:hypothetical protein [Pontibaca salina]|uniref:Integrase catalytic domain-containing protein n=1 Tax=Pontibaca salina TaxID=2795731 RepID=A0A934HPD3_9RHOB|nr:hypothetical protein [Pontibaca salina]MBI6630736.1 hypothetical protein [Pontibaca salina]